MYQYNDADQRLVDERVARFRDQMHRFLAGELAEDDFRPLRLQNGLYIQRHAPMLRVAIPYGTMSSTQLHMLARIAREFDRGYGHFTTRCNIQYNWVRLEDTPDILAELATVQMHAIQTSGNCIRNITTDHFAGVAADEVLDPRPYCEILRQWSTLSPEYSFLPRKFKIALTGSSNDRAAVRFHDIGARALQREDGEIGFEVFVGGGLGRTPMVGHRIQTFLPRHELLSYFEAILRVYNRHGRRDKKYKSRIKILVKELGPEVFSAEVAKEWAFLRGGPATITDDKFEAMERHFRSPHPDGIDSASSEPGHMDEPAFRRWISRNVTPHKVPGLAIVTLSLKQTGNPPGDATAAQMDAIADLASTYSADEIRVSHEQNLILPHVRIADLYALWSRAIEFQLASPNIGMLTDVVCCPGGDFCSLANARSIPVAQAIQQRFGDPDALDDLGPVELNISGCVNACGHHHIGHIGILGVDKNGEEWYQVTLGGSQDAPPAIGKIVGPSFRAEDVPEVIEKVMTLYRAQRTAGEPFIDTVRRLGTAPFKQHLYGSDNDTHPEA
ncbi:nitrite/sulfite reductase [Azoarcus sp. L1K30]|uniref:nitrite/sulfite reductase n=1 Tax=Azoarcus sp. L1K30 TaxID=2820277 RepID=UPI001B826DFC|nr:nitrite/sulfite reductase [Azoarcus sp. L1K30]MBR0564701.1 nitrite/sulfite reductase [Azoarcus sp. L1K30]